MGTLDESNQILQQIGQLAVQKAPNPWDMLWIEADFSTEGIIDFKCSHLANGERRERSFNILGASPLFQKLRQITKKEGQENWKKATLEILKEGKFNINFDY